MTDEEILEKADQLQNRINVLAKEVSERQDEMLNIMEECDKLIDLAKANLLKSCSQPS
jgi:regulator of replication initiation timing